MDFAKVAALKRFIKLFRLNSSPLRPDKDGYVTHSLEVTYCYSFLSIVVRFLKIRCPNVNTYFGTQNTNFSFRVNYLLFPKTMGFKFYIVLSFFSSYTKCYVSDVKTTKVFSRRNQHSVLFCLVSARVNWISTKNFFWFRQITILND